MTDIRPEDANVSTCAACGKVIVGSTLPAPGHIRVHASCVGYKIQDDVEGLDPLAWRRLLHEQRRALHHFPRHPEAVQYDDDTWRCEACGDLGVDYQDEGDDR